MHEVVAFAAADDSRRIRIRRHGGDGLREPFLKQVDGNDTDERPFGVIDGTGVGGDDLLLVFGFRIGIEIGVNPTAPLKVLGVLIPVEVEILELIAAILCR